MTKTKKSKEVILAQQRLRQQKRREKIKKDPILYAAYKEKDRLKYYKRKREGKIVPIHLETPERKIQIRKRNRNNAKAYFRRQKEKRTLDVIEELSVTETPPEEIFSVDISQPILDTEIDPLASTSEPSTSRRTLRSFRKKVKQPPASHPNTSKHNLRSVGKTAAKLLDTPNPSSTAKDETQIMNNVEETAFESFEPVSMPSNSSTPNITPSTSSGRRLNLCNNKFQSRLNALNTSTPNAGLTSCDSEDNELSSICSSPTFQPKIQRDSSNSSIATSCSENTLSSTRKKTSPTTLALKRFKYKTNKMVKGLYHKIHDLKKLNDRYRKQISRLTRVPETKTKLSKNIEMTMTSDNKIQKSLNNIKQDIEQFLEQDEFSRMCSGKREYITKNKIKKQRRYLNDSLQNLHKKFIQTVTYRIGYSTFCRMRPFWILIPDVKARDTCMCKTHANMDLIVTALHRFHITNENTAHKILSSICCDPSNVECLTRRCMQCTTKTILFKEFDNSEQIHYLHWVSKKQTYFGKDGKENCSNKIVKDKILASSKDVINKFENMLLPYMTHCANMISQNKYIKKLKDNLKEGECIVNYNTKYAFEIQSFHFAGSRKQLTLHTVVMYYIKDSKLVTQSLCSVSKSLRHDAVAVWEHLMPVLKHIEANVPHVRVIHFISDSPSGQYRNKKMFFIMSELRRDYSNLTLLTWNYTESGHGKGAPDGVGAVIKRTADRLVAQGNDIVDIETFTRHLSVNIQGVILEVVEESAILQKDLLFPVELREFKGTMKVHQVVWSHERPDNLAMRKLSCDLQDCYQPVECTHLQHVGFYKIINGQENINPCASSTTKQRRNVNPRMIDKSAAAIVFDKPVILSNEIVKSPSDPSAVFKAPFKEIKKVASVENEMDLKLADDDSFWAPVSPADVNVTLPSLQENKQSDEDDFDIF